MTGIPQEDLRPLTTDDVFAVSTNGTDLML